MQEQNPTSSQYQHAQITLRAPKTLLNRVSAVARDDYNTRASVIRQFIAEGLRKREREIG